MLKDSVGNHPPFSSRYDESYNQSPIHSNFKTKKNLSEPYTALAHINILNFWLYKNIITDDVCYKNVKSNFFEVLFLHEISKT